MLGNVKSFRLLHRKSDMSVKAFQLHWRTVHAEHALKLNAYLQRYVQNHAWPEPIANFHRPCDGSPELWYKDAEKALFFVKRNASLSPDAFQTRWRQSNKALVGVAPRAK